MEIDNVEVHSALSEALSLTGYCPQFDALWPRATPYELMMFAGISSGLSEAEATTTTEQLVLPC